jgi:hypothetical protein
VSGQFGIAADRRCVGRCSPHLRPLGGVLSSGVLTYLRGCCPVPALAGSLRRVALPHRADWRLDAAGRPAADPETVEHAWERIERDGWTIIASHTRPYVYTAGLTALGWPELVMRVHAIPHEVAGALLCELKCWYDEEKRLPQEGDVVPVSRFTVRLATIEERLVAGVCPVAHSLYGGGPVRAMDVVARLVEAEYAV